MSISFWCPAAPKYDGPCYCKESGYECDEYCPGTREHSEAPEFNLATTNAFNLLRLVDIDPSEYYGEIKVEQLGEIQQRLLRVINSEKQRSHLVEEKSEFGGPGTGYCKVVCCGNTDEQTLRRLNQLQKLVSYAQEHGYQISWA